MSTRVTNVLVIGAGGHARVCIEALRDDPALHVIGAVSRDGTALDGLGCPLVGTDEDLDTTAQRVGATAACVAIGDNAARHDATARWLGTGGALVVARSRHAVISPTAEVGPGSMLLPGAVVNAATVLGTGVIVNTNASVDHDTDVGDFVHIAPGVAMGGGVTIGARTLVGLGARVLPGITVGVDAVIGAGAVVIRDVPDGETVVGNPARPLGDRR